MKHVINEQSYQLKLSSDHNEVLKRRIEEITGLILELMECKSPPLVYAFFLKEKLANFKLTRIVECLNPSISTPHEFYDTFQSVPMPLKNLLCELYLRKLAVPNEIE